MSICFVVPSFFMKIFREGELEINNVGADLFILDVSLVALLVVLYLGLIVVTQTGVLERHCNCFACERVVVILAMALMLLACCVDPHYLAKICGCGKTAGAGPATDSTLLLKIDIYLTLTHLGLPIRWETLLLLDVEAILVYVVFAFGLGSPEQARAPQHLVLLMALTIGAMIGRRNCETFERASFLAILHEKTQRTELEFKLSSRVEAVVERGEDATSISPSNHTGRLFSEIDAGGLRQIAKLGAKEHWLLSSEALELAPEDVLGRGSFGIVVAGLLHGTPVAIKVPTSSTGSATFAELANELRILRQLRNTHIVSFHGAWIDFQRGSLVLVEELVEGPPLDEFLLGGGDPRNDPDGAVRRCLVLGVCRGLQYLHEHDPCIVHGDLKPENIRVEPLGPRPRPKLLDFGLSRLIKGTPEPLGGTLRWMAPEVIANQLDSAVSVFPSPAADVFSFGRLAYFIATGAKPLQGYENPDILRSAGAGQLPPLLWPAGAPPFTHLCAPIADQCMSADPARRPEMGRVREYFSKRPRGGEPAECQTGALAHPSTECVPWEAGLQDLLAAMSQPTGVRRRSGRPRTPGNPNGNPNGDPPQTDAGGPIYSDFGLTSLTTQHRMVLWCLAHWNIDVRSTHCCRFHAVVASLSDICDSLRVRACNDVLLETLTCDKQCPNCLAMRIIESEASGSIYCSVCNFPIQGADGSGDQGGDGSRDQRGDGSGDQRGDGSGEASV